MGSYPIAQTAAISRLPQSGGQPRARGDGMLRVKRSNRGTALADLYQSGATKLLFPRSDPELMQAVLINTAGGITGGDRFSVTARAGQDTHLSLTTQAAERLYRAQPEETAQVDTRLEVGQGARIDWLPQETILFNRCALRRRLTVDLDIDASVLLVEPLVFGRALMGETLTDASFNDRIEVRRNGRPMFLDATRFSGNVSAHLANVHTAANAGAMALIIYASADAEAHLASVRAHLPPTAGASLIAPDLLVARLLAPDSFILRGSLVPLIRYLTQDSLPRSWIT